jgi:hypothetical protein
VNVVFANITLLIMLLKIMIGFMFLRIMTYRGNGKNSSDNYNPSLILLLLSGNLMNMVINGNNNICCILIISQEVCAGYRG